MMSDSNILSLLAEDPRVSDYTTYCLLSRLHKCARASLREVNHAWSQVIAKSGLMTSIRPRDIYKYASSLINELPAKLGSPNRKPNEIQHHDIPDIIHQAVSQLTIYWHGRNHSLVIDGYKQYIASLVRCRFGLIDCYCIEYSFPHGNNYTETWRHALRKHPKKFLKDLHMYVVFPARMFPGDFWAAVDLIGSKVGATKYDYFARNAIYEFMVQNRLDYKEYISTYFSEETAAQLANSYTLKLYEGIVARPRLFAEYCQNLDNSANEFLEQYNTLCSAIPEEIQAMNALSIISATSENYIANRSAEILFKHVSNESILEEFILEVMPRFDLIYWLSHRSESLAALHPQSILSAQAYSRIVGKYIKTGKEIHVFAIPWQYLHGIFREHAREISSIPLYISGLVRSGYKPVMKAMLEIHRDGLIDTQSMMDIIYDNRDTYSDEVDSDEECQ